MSQAALEVVIILSVCCSFLWLGWAMIEAAKMEWKLWKHKRAQKQVELIKNAVNPDIAEVGNMALENKRQMYAIEKRLARLEPTPAEEMQLLKRVSSSRKKRK